MKSWISLTEREICKYIVMFQVVVYNCSRIWLYERVAENQSNFKICSGVSRRAFPIKKNGRNKKKSNDTNNAKTAAWKYSQIVKKPFLEYSNHVNANLISMFCTENLIYFTKYICIYVSSTTSLPLIK
jgi:Pyruvate/2-oxoacid:ferredoxin oxidoreductase delta subunit